LIELGVATEQVAQKTRSYAKRQETFWRMLRRSLTHAVREKNVSNVSLEELNLTLSDPHLYINQLLQRLANLQ
jgi:tRNA A37 N6-isopentenylltransferase MiaA